MPLRRIIEPGMTYTIDEENADEIELRETIPILTPPVDIQGEPWGWTKTGPRPKGWPGPDENRNEPGPYDGEWEPSNRDVW